MKFVETNDKGNYMVFKVFHFMLNEKCTVSGAVPTDMFLKVLQKVAEEERASAVMTGINKSSTVEDSTDSSCRIPNIILIPKLDLNESARFKWEAYCYDNGQL